MSAPLSTAITPTAPAEILTFGCRLNAHESAQIGALAAQAGVQDAVIVNTCAVTEEAVRQARQAIRRARRARPGARVIVTGCAAQIDPAAFAAMPEVDHVVGNLEKLKLETWAAADLPRTAVSDIMAATTVEGPSLPHAPQRTRAEVQVQTGCDHRCTFCVIPYGRGNARSVPAGAVVAEVARLVAAGAPEVVLTGVDLTSWGADLPGRPPLGNLVGRILSLAPDLPRLRLSSLDVIEVDPALFTHLTRSDRVAPHLHLSLQHGHDLILKRMKRRHSAAAALDLIARLRAARPDIAFGADFIAGFPTETETEFQALLDFVVQANIAFVHAFPFSPRPGAPATRMPQVPRAVIKARAARLRAVGAAQLSRHLGRWVGRTALALVERPGAARLPDFTQVALEGGQAGASVPVRITGHDGARLLARRT